MNSRERLLAAMRREPVDYVPMQVGFWPPIAPEHLRWKDERGRMETYDTLGLDKVLYLRLEYSQAPGVTSRVWQTSDPQSPYPLLHKEFQTPAGPLSAIVKRTEDWPWGEDIPFLDDFSPPRYVKPWVQSVTDVERLRYVLQPPQGAVKDHLAAQARETQALAREYGAIVAGMSGSGLDLVCWMCGFSQAVIMGVEQPKVIEKLLDLVHDLNLPGIDLLAELGADYIDRRGWYESTDFWSPRMFAQYARPLLEAEIERTHRYGLPFLYLMVTGIMPLLPQLAELPFDVLIQLEPALGGQDLRAITRALPGKAFLGGISAPIHLGEGTPETVRQAVRDAFDIFGHRGFILGCSASIRSYFPWENVQALMDEWKRLRTAQGVNA